jgi:hypothetical protein
VEDLVRYKNGGFIPTSGLRRLLTLKISLLAYWHNRLF